MNSNKQLAIFIIGVSGVGKSTVGKLLSQELAIPFFDGDDFHPKENIEKMKIGQPLVDTDRLPWLKSLNNLAKQQLQKNSCIIACSALKEAYRVILKKGIESQIKWILLDGSFNLIQDRLNKRSAHFMPSSLLKSQFDILDKPLEAIKVDVILSPKEMVNQIKKELMGKSEFGIIGLGIMGKNLARNLASSGFRISIFNRHLKGIEEGIALKAKKEFEEFSEALPFDNLEAFISSLQSPRKILLMVNAGKPVDNILEQLVPLLSKNDIVIDGGNSHYNKTKERQILLEKHHLHFIGVGISGGEDGALNGPSIMPGGNKNAYQFVQPFLEAIAAKDSKGNPCCAYIGEDGSGHFVKMVHNGIEYAEMQLLAEVYFILKHLGKNPDEIATILESWRTTVNSYLLEITIEILRKKEKSDWLIDKILDISANKGTGNWATVAMAELGIPSTMISAALFSRYISAFKDDRIKMSHVYPKKNTDFKIDISNLSEAYQLASVINHHQGFQLLNQASETFNWQLKLSEIARIWSNGCIIRSAFMEDLQYILRENSPILLNKKVIALVVKLKSSLSTIVVQSILNDIPISCFSEAINFLNGYSQDQSSANLIQAQRDYFGSHTYQRIDDLSGKSYHTNWRKDKHD